MACAVVGALAMHLLFGRSETYMLSGHLGFGAALFGLKARARTARGCWLCDAVPCHGGPQQA